MPQKRNKIPSDIENRLLTNNRHTCCICKERHDVIIHHIDGNRSNNGPQNLAVLCVGCHSLVHSNQGLGRQYTAQEVKIYKNEWEDRCKVGDHKKVVINKIYVFAEGKPFLSSPDFLRNIISNVSSGATRTEVSETLSASANIVAETTDDQVLADEFVAYATVPSALELQTSLNALYDAMNGGGTNQLKVLKTADGKSFEIFLLAEQTQERITVELADDYINRWPVTNAEKEIIKVFEKLRKARID